ncbi:MAG: hypothetical protein HOE53_00050 [Candidatus Magasanikbacteria bacterium]|jgi:hypothetical protein|nr:hypothetical protein [Candidatus Magasanikbacteria bacterium]
MSETLIRHLIAFMGILVTGLVYWIAYASGARGWWWTVLGLIIIYGMIYKLVDA